MKNSDEDRSKRAAPGRYDRVRDARMPADGVATVPKAQRAHVITAAVADPYEDGKLRMAAAVNTRVDILELELSRKLISQAAYLEGRRIQALLERLGGSTGGGGIESSRGDPVLAREQKHKRMVIAIRAVQDLETAVRGRIGLRDWRLIRWVIGDRISYAAIAGADERMGQHGRGYVGQRFRDALEELSEAVASRGKPSPPPNDEYLAASADLAARQAASIRGGATREAMEAEMAELLEEADAAKGRERGRLQEAAFELEARLARMREAVGTP